jgi:hypothetical protein
VPDSAPFCAKRATSACYARFFKNIEVRVQKAALALRWLKTKLYKSALKNAPRARLIKYHR